MPWESKYLNLSPDGMQHQFQKETGLQTCKETYEALQSTARPNIIAHFANISTTAESSSESNTDSLHEFERLGER